MNLPKSLNVLLVEDLVSDSFLLQRQFKKICKNPEIRFVDSELSLINALKTFIPDLIITDFNLVGMDAFDVIRITKEYNAKIPVVVITAHLKNEADRDSLLENGAYGFFLKEPINTLNDRLAPLVHSIMDKNQKNMEILNRERTKYVDRKSDSDFLRAHDSADPEVPKSLPIYSFWRSIRNLLGASKHSEA